MHSDLLDRIKSILRKHEGLQLKPYDDKGRISIGYGRNLTENGISLDEAEMMLETDILHAIDDLKKVLPNAHKTTENRRIAIADMMYNLGLTKFRGFKKFIEAFNSEEWDKAADEILDSKAAKELPSRYGELAKMVRNG